MKAQQVLYRNGNITTLDTGTDPEKQGANAQLFGYTVLDHKLTGHEPYNALIQLNYPDPNAKGYMIAQLSSLRDAVQQARKKKDLIAQRDEQHDAHGRFAPGKLSGHGGGVGHIHGGIAGHVQKVKTTKVGGAEIHHHESSVISPSHRHDPTISAPQRTEMHSEKQAARAQKQLDATGTSQANIEHRLEERMATIPTDEHGNVLGQKWYFTANEWGGREAARLGMEKNRLLGMAAVLSPETEWEQNKRETLTIASTLRESERRVAAGEQDYQVHITKGGIAAYNKEYVGKRGAPATAFKDGDVVDLHALSAAEKSAFVDFGVTGKKKWDATYKAIRLYNGEHPHHVVGGAKVRSFHNNLVAPHDARFATMDTWMYRIGTGWDRANPLAGDLLNVTVNGKIEHMTLFQYEHTVVRRDSKGSPIFGKSQDLFQKSGKLTNPQDAWTEGTYTRWVDALSAVSARHDPPMSPSEYQAAVWNDIVFQHKGSKGPAKEK